MMMNRHISIVVAVASMFVINVVQGAEIRPPSGLRFQETAGARGEDVSEESTDGDIGGFVQAEMSLEKGIKCKGKAERKKGVGKECEGGVKKKMSVGIGAQDLAEDIANEVEDMQKNMMPDQKSLIPTDDIMMELLGLDNDIMMMDGEDCTEDGCSKTVEFGGYFKLFWGCNVTFSKKGLKMSKDVVCGGKSFEGMGKKPEDDEMLVAKYYDIEENEF